MRKKYTGCDGGVERVRGRESLTEAMGATSKELAEEDERGRESDKNSDGDGRKLLCIQRKQEE